MSTPADECADPTSLATGIIAEPTQLLRDLAKLRTASSPMHAIAYVTASPMRQFRSGATMSKLACGRSFMLTACNTPQLRQPRGSAGTDGSSACDRQPLGRHDQATQIGSIAYATERRARIWLAVSTCLQNSSHCDCYQLCDGSTIARQTSYPCHADQAGYRKQTGWRWLGRVPAVRQNDFLVQRPQW